MEGKLISEGWDPKNRLVTLTQVSGKGASAKYIVRKPDTGYESEPVSKKEAETFFQFQISCSQNQ